MRAEYKVTVPRSHLAPTSDGRGQVRVADSSTEHKISIEIDLDAIANELGIKAVTNRSGVAKYLHGLIVVRRLS